MGPQAETSVTTTTSQPRGSAGPSSWPSHLKDEETVSQRRERTHLIPGTKLGLPLLRPQHLGVESREILQLTLRKEGDIPGLISLIHSSLEQPGGKFFLRLNLNSSCCLPSCQSSVFYDLRLLLECWHLLGSIILEENL